MNYLRTIPLILASIIVLSGCSSGPKKATAADTVAVGEKSIIPVKVVNLTRTKIARTIDYTATILPFEEVNMAPSTPGRIDKIYVEEGDRVNKGVDLFLMDRT